MSARTWLKRPGRAGSIFLGLLMVAGVGCGERGRVSGTVNYRGQPLTDGTVLLVASDGQPYHGQIGPDGRFRIPEVPPGEAHVAVTSLAEDRRFGASGWVGGHSRVGQQAPMYSRIPMHYGDLAQSGLTATVEGDTALELNLQ